MSPVCARSVGGLDVMTLNGENVVFGPRPRLRRPTLPFITRPPRGPNAAARARPDRKVKKEGIDGFRHASRSLNCHSLPFFLLHSTRFQS